MFFFVKYRHITMKYKHLTEAQRYEMKAYLQCGKTQRFIAAALGVSASTISRELSRNGLKRGGYNPKKAHEQARGD